MSKALYWTSASTARKVTQPYLVMGGVTKKVKAGYNVVGGVTRQFFTAVSNPFESYSGAYTAQRLTVDGVPYILYTLTGSGTLKLTGNARFWMCGGGARGGQSGETVSSDYARSGPGGGGGYLQTLDLAAGEYVIGIASGNGGISTIKQGGTTLGSADGGKTGISTSGGNGGSGGGAARTYDWQSNLHGAGAGVPTAPFGILALKYHCPGGAGGNYNNTAKGANGGSNGSYGRSIWEGIGGDYGGGNSGKAATFYGGGGGGAIANYSPINGGDGYQGVAYVLIPDEGYKLAA